MLIVLIIPQLSTINKFFVEFCTQFVYRTRFFVVLLQALTSSKTEREEQRRRGSEPQAPDKSTQSLVRSVFLHQSDKWHNEATPLNVRAVSVSLPVGLCRRQKGETREEGGHII